jgi:hypothetical protein
MVAFGRGLGTVKRLSPREQSNAVEAGKINPSRLI